jgi:D-xylose transport system permease protein
MSDLKTIDSMPNPNAAKPTLRKPLFERGYGAYLALFALVLVMAVATHAAGRPNYLSAVNVGNVLYQSSLVSIMAVGMTIVLITGNIDLSVASVAALSAAVLIAYCDHVGFAWASIAALSVAAVCGVLNGVVVQFLKVNAFITTLGTMTALRGALLVFSDGRSLSIDDASSRASMQAFEATRFSLRYVGYAAVCLAIGASVALLIKTWNDKGSVGRSIVSAAASVAALLTFVLLLPSTATVAIPVLYAATVATAVWFVAEYTVLGRRLYAVGGNAEAARLSGIDVRAYKVGGFISCSVTAGLAGVLFGSRLGAVNPNSLEGTELTVIAAAILGGTSLHGGAGSIFKSLAGAVFLFALNNGFNILNLGANAQKIVEGIVIVSAAAIYALGESRGRRGIG